MSKIITHWLAHLPLSIRRGLAPKSEGGLKRPVLQISSSRFGWFLAGRSLKESPKKEL